MKLGFIARVMAAVFAVAGIAPAAEFEFQFGGGLSEEHPHTIAHRHFAKRVEELTGGRVKIEVFPSNQLGAERERIEALQMGTLDFTKVMTSVLANFMPEMNVFSLPYLYKGNAHFQAVIKSDICKDMVKGLEKVGIKGIAWYFAGNRCIYNSRRPVNTPGDMRGLKIRVPENPVMIDTINAMGGTGVPVNLAEIYTSIRTGVVDGAENSTLFYYEQKHSEVAKFYSYTNHMVDTNIAIMSLESWNRLPEDCQKAVEQAGRETEEFLFSKWLEIEADFNKRLEEQGIAFNQADVDAFREACRPVWQKHGSRLPAGLIDSILNIKF
ncbi:MAG: TRAP transporter substrate-binding protein [Planctomycetota bacterium]|jgi:tripartite ATP-independent transporter DctP family solute receptor|nr:TRAP transporter substrate-binding protein [Planctomycetota bacterium]